MKIMRYLFHPLKILVYLMVILSLIYFRSVIFLPNINQYVDTTQQFIEDKLDISIPVYINKNSLVEKVAQDKLVDRSEAVKVTTDSCVNDIVVVSEVASDIVDNKPVVVEKTVTKVDKKEPEVVAEDRNKSDPENDMFTQLTTAINNLNSKVDKLFDAAKSSVNKAVETPDNAAPLLDSKPRDSSEKKLPTNESSDSNNIKSNVNQATATDVKRLFYIARKIYWTGDALGAEKLYLELAAADNDDPDIYGELGNVYYAQGKWQDAGKAYYEAAIRLLNSNKNNQLYYLLRVIQLLDSVSAEKLKQKMSS